MKTEIVFQDPDFYSQDSPVKALRHRREFMSAFLVVSDILAISVSILTAIALWRQVRADLQLEAHLFLIPPAVIFSTLIYRLMALYPGIGIGPVEELKRLTTSTSFLIMAMIALSFFLRSTVTYSRATLIISWILILVSVPILRKLFRRLAIKLGFWGIPVAIVGEAENVTRIQKRLSLHPLSGLWPVLCIAGRIKDIFPKENNENILLSRINTLILVTDQGKFDSIRHLITQKEYQFRRIILILDETKIGPIWFTPINIVEHIGLEVAHNLLNKGQQFSKRVTEVALIILSTPIFIALSSVIGIAIKLTSPGPILYKHKRVGYHGKVLSIWKFRTMFLDADTMLTQHLENDPALQKEWNGNFKLKVDPRVTGIGNILRRTSLDELPQVWNVMKGEMSLIGPRPIVQEEISLYGEEFEIYKQVHPGITGLWQISGRNDLPYQDRVALDVYYIQNWSIWLDIHVLIHTALATIQGRGAY